MSYPWLREACPSRRARRDDERQLLDAASRVRRSFRLSVLRRLTACWYLVSQGGGGERVRIAVYYVLDDAAERHGLFLLAGVSGGVAEQAVDIRFRRGCGSSVNETLPAKLSCTVVVDAARRCIK